MTGYIPCRNIWTESLHGQCIQYATSPDESPSASKKKVTCGQHIIGTLIYYERAVGPTLVDALSTIASRLSTVTSIKMSGVNHLLDYCSTHPEAKVQYYAADI
jgi:hypothetical protein